MSTLLEELNVLLREAERFMSEGLAANERPLDAYQLCWCQSGKKWKFCHRIRESLKPLAFGELTALAAKEEDAWVRQSHTCLHPDASPSTCSSGIIASHTVQRKGGLAAIAENGHVLSPRKGIQNVAKNQGKILPARIGLRDASTFPGFCNAHDTQMFKPVEQPGASLDRLNAFLLSFRAIVYEYVMKQFALASYGVKRDNVDRGADFRRQVDAQESLYGFNLGAKRALAGLNRLRRVYDDAYRSGDLSGFNVYGVTFDSVLPFVASGAFLPEFDFRGDPIQVIGTESDVDEVAFNVTVLGNVTVGVFGWWGMPRGPAHRFVDSFDGLPDEDKATALATCAFEYLENLYLRESWWNSLSPDERLACDDLIHSGTRGERSPTGLRNQKVPRLTAGIAAVLDWRP